MRKVIVLLVLALNLNATELENRRVQIDSIGSFYADKFEGRKTASGERFYQSKLTCAYNGLPLGTEVKITRILKSDTYTVQVKVNDRTAKRYSHRIDLSKAAAKKLKISGIAPVTIEVL